MQHTDFLPKLVFIVGCQRSGTTLTGQILAAHQNCLMVDEDDAAYDLFEAASATDGLRWDTLSPYLEKISEKYRSPGRWIEGLGTPAPRAAPQITHIAFKSPNLTYFADEIAALPNPSHVVGLVRDPRSVVASMTRLSRVPMIRNQVRWINRLERQTLRYADELKVLSDDAVADHVKRALIWRIKTELIDSFPQMGLPTTHLKYEDLVADPLPRIAELLDAVGLPPDEGAARHQDLLKGRGPGGTQRARAVDQKSQSLWSEAMSADIAKTVLETTGDLARRFDYA